MLNAQFRLAVHLAQVILENCLGHEYRRENVGDKTDCQGNGESTDGAGSENEQEKRRHYRRDVRVDNRYECLIKPCIDCSRRGLAVAQLFAYALEDQHVGVDAHTNCQNHPRNTRQGEYRTKHGQRGKQE